MRPQSLNALGQVSGIPTDLPTEREREPGLERGSVFFVIIISS